MRPIVRLGLALLLLCPLGLLASDADADGRMLDGRTAPDMSFTEGLFGLEQGATLSSFRGRPVFIKFWLRDCPHCRKTLPTTQRYYDQYGRAGLQVMTVIHAKRPHEVQPVMRQLGYDFPVVVDLDGSQAKKYGVGRRPVDYLIGIDGRVVSSNSVSDALITKELGKYRVARLGSVPASMSALTSVVAQGRMGSALKTAETAADAAGASADVKAVARRTRELAEETLDARTHWADVLARQGHKREAVAEYSAVTRAFAGTSLGADAAKREADFLRSQGR